MSYSDVIRDIRAVPHLRVMKCDGCGSEIRAHVLDVYGPPRRPRHGQGLARREGEGQAVEKDAQEQGHPFGGRTA